MLYLILSILSNVGILLVFRIAGLRKVHALSMVVVNYLIATILGITVFLLDGKALRLNNLEPNFYFVTIVIGVLFMLLFLVVQSSSNKAGMAITSVAAKLSVLIPVIVSLFIDPLDTLNITKVVGLSVMFLAVVLIIYNPNLLLKRKLEFFLPLVLFLGMGVLDSVVKTSQQFVIGEERVPLFTLLSFFVAGISGTTLIIIRKEIGNLFNAKNALFGLALGVFNYGSLIFLVKTLNLNLSMNEFLDSSRIFMLNNIGIIILSVLIGVIVFRERLHTFNYLGLLLSLYGFYLLV
jgi:hypothetical protein